MYHDLRGCLSRCSRRPCQKGTSCLLLLSLPFCALVYALVQSRPGSLRGALVWQIDEADNAVLQAPPSSTTARIRPKEEYVIHIWRHGERMKRRFLRSYGQEQRDPFELCSVRNCRLTTDDSLVNESDAVLFHLHQTKGPHTLPTKGRSPSQVWIFFTDESPLHTFLATRKYTMRDYDGLFNWSMTYRADSDVAVPYGRTVPLTLEEEDMYEEGGHHRDFARSKTRGIAILGSNCGGANRRWDYVRELRRHVAVDVYGACGTHACPGHFTRDCPVLADYKFYLAFENSNCAEYVTEKMWWNAYHKETVPVVMGAPRADYERLCPPNSFIHVDDFESPSELATYLSFLLNNDTAYNSFFEWKRRYRVVNEHGYFGSPSLHVCRMCETLNRLETLTPKTYTNLTSFWSPQSDCRPATWTPKKSTKA